MKPVPSIIEGVLFVWGDAIDISELMKICDCNRKELEEGLESLENRLKATDSALILRRFGSSVRLMVHESYNDWISKLVEQPRARRLSNSAMETLSIIAYNQPITRIEIDEIRGVNSSGSIDTLIKNGLIEEAGRLDRIGKPILYRTTNAFLEYFDLIDLSYLPSLINNPENKSNEDNLLDKEGLS